MKSIVKKIDKNPFTLAQSVFMRKVAVVTLCILLAGCGKQAAPKECNFEHSTGSGFNCIVLPFLEGVTTVDYKPIDSDSYVIKGVALDSYSFGRRIKLVEDLKGNFPKNVDTFIAWGSLHSSHPLYDNTKMYYGSLESMESLYCSDCYSPGEVLIMLLMPPILTPENIGDCESELGFDILEGRTWIETTEKNFETIPCVFSVLKLSNGYVRGVIYEHCCWSWPDVYSSKTPMSWHNFQKELNDILKTIK